MTDHGIAGRQLSFDIAPRTIDTPNGARPAEVIGGELTIKGAVGLPHNLEHGDELVITISGPDGEVLAQAQAEVAKPPSFVPVDVKDIGLVGYVRAHTAKIVDES